MSETVSINISDDEEGHLSGEEDVTVSQQAPVPHPINKDLASNLFKWTNYIHGWQERYIVLKDGVLSYYKSPSETHYGCRGAIALKQSSIMSHELDDCRFDIKVNDCVWYLRAKSVEERQLWLNMLEELRGESGYGSQTSLRKHGSMLSLNSTASLSMTSTASSKRGFGLKEKLAEMETFKDILCRQVETLQTYFDACANSLTKGFEPYHKELERLQDAHSDDDDDDNLDENEGTIVENRNGHVKVTNANKAVIEDHGHMSLDFKGEAFTFKATTTGILHDLSLCIELMQQREEFWKKKLDKEVERRKKVEEKYTALSKEQKTRIVIAGPDFEEGPHSNMREEQFFDAIDSSLDTLELAEDRRVEAFKSLTEIPELEKVPEHRLSEEIARIVGDHLKYDLQDDLNSSVWELLASDGEMKIYRRELEENGLVLDPLKAVHTVKGITGHELCKYFWDPAVRMEWEGTLDSSRMIEALSDDTLIFHQTHKRVWPSAQRDTCFWSHIRSVEKKPDPNDKTNTKQYPDWIVVNYSTEHPLAPQNIIRANLNVAMICETTTSSQSSEPVTDRNEIICKITYVALVNPGGWAPANVLRAVYKREYPKFVKRFTQYVIDKTAKQPILF